MAYVKDEYIEQAIADFDEIKKALVSNGVDVQFGTDTKEYGKLVDNALIKGNQAEEDLNQTIKWYGELYLIDDPPTQFTENATITYMPPLDFSGKTSLANAFYKCSALEKVALINTSGVTDFNSCFAGCKMITEIPLIDTSSGIDFTKMFSQCSALISTPCLDLSNGTVYNSMFIRDTKLQKIEAIFSSNPASYNCFASQCSVLKEVISTSILYPTDAYNMFYRNQYLETVPTMDLSNATSLSGILMACTKLKNVSFVENSIKLSVSISSAVLSDESIQSIIDGLATVETTCTLSLHSDVLAKLTDAQIETLANKNWTTG